MRRALIGLTVAVCGLPACGDSGSPTTPTATTTAVSVNLRDVVLVGATATATATATLSNSQTQLVSATWRSDAAGVATITEAGGTVTGVANGEATITASYSGRDGTKRIRVAPNYDGRWQGSQRINTCGATGDWIGFCEENSEVIGALLPTRLTARHPGDLTVSGEFSIEEDTFPTFTTPVQSDGSIAFSAATTLDGLIQVEVSWQMNSAQNGRAAGSTRLKFTAPGLLAGDLTFDATLSDFSRSGAASLERVQGPTRLSTLTSRVRAKLRR